MSMRKNWEAEKNKLARMAIKPSIFRVDLGRALDSFDIADKKAEGLRGGDKKDFAAAKKVRTQKAGEAALIVRTYEGILKGLTTTPMQKIVVDEALVTLTGIALQLSRQLL